jgi:pyruvate dehydrogenase E1 component
VWAFLGDGEMDEPESRGCLQIAAQEELDNLTFVVNCNLQRLDGPVRGNGKIIQELESFFRGAGWNVIKVVWGRGWDPLLAADKDGALVHLMNTTPDGDYQTFRANDGTFIREQFFGRDPRTKKLVKDWTDEDIWWKLKRGGHDYRKVFAAYRRRCSTPASRRSSSPRRSRATASAPHFAGRNATHQMKKLTLDDLKDFRDGLRIPIDRRAARGRPLPPAVLPPG